MKIKSLIMAAMLLVSFSSFVSCTKDNSNKDDDEKPVFNQVITTKYIGDMDVVFQGQSVTTENAKVSVIDSTGLKKMNLYFPQVQFVPAMPKLDITIPSITYSDSNNGAKTFSGTGIIPTIGPIEYPQYTVTNLIGTISSEGKISISATIGAFPITFEGGNELK